MIGPCSSEDPAETGIKANSIGVYYEATFLIPFYSRAGWEVRAR